MTQEQERNLLLEFSNRKTFIKFEKSLKTNAELKDNIKEVRRKEILLNFENKEKKDYTINYLNTILKPCSIKTTDRGFKYLKIYW